MPDYEAVIDGKSRKIELTRTASNNFTAKIDGEPRKIELQTEKISPEQAFSIRIDEKTYNIELRKAEQEKVIPIKIEEAVFEVEIRSSDRKQIATSFEPALQASARKTGTVRLAAVEGAILAPMTGRIVKVKVKRGDQVKANQVLCTIEAMKMENEIAAPKAGGVQEVNVSDGSAVSEGDVLFIVA
jgi:biotin carboxyl carrier protein